MGFFAGWRRIHGFSCSFPFPLMLILSRNFRVHSSRETAQIERTELPQAPTNLERFRCRFKKTAIYANTAQLPIGFTICRAAGSRLQRSGEFLTNTPLFLRRSLSQILTGFLSGNLKKPCGKRAFEWFSIPHPAAKSVPEFLKKSVHSACEMCPAEEGMFVSQMRKQTLPKTACRYAFARGGAVPVFFKSKGSQKGARPLFLWIAPFDKPPTKGYNTDIWFRY